MHRITIKKDISRFRSLTRLSNSFWAPPLFYCCSNKHVSSVKTSLYRSVNVRCGILVSIDILVCNGSSIERWKALGTEPIANEIYI